MKTKQKLLLLLVSIISVIAMLPYFFESNNALIEESNIPVSDFVFSLSIILQSAVFISIAIWSGIYFVNKTGIKVLSCPRGSTIVNSLITGVTTALVLLIIDYFFHTARITPNFFTVEKITVWKTLFVCFYGGIVEEILLRLFLLTFLLFLINKVSNDRYKNASITIAITITALLFAAGHIPVIQMQTTLNPLIITRVMLLNSVAGLIFGYLYIKRGLFSAIIAHFSADFILIFLFPLLFS